MSDKDKLDKNLIDDNEFVALMAAEFEAEGKPVDVLSKKRTWNELESQLKNQVPDPRFEGDDGKNEGDKFWQIGLALAACIMLSVVIALIKPMFEQEQGIKGTEEPVPVELHAYHYTDDGELIIFKADEVSPPINVVPMVRSTQPVVAAFLSIAGDGTPEVIVARQSIHPGAEEGFVIGPDEIFSVEWTGKEREVYCVVAFENEKDLAEELERMQQDQSFTFDGNCLVLPEAK